MDEKMTDKETLKKEIEEIIRDHNHKRASRRKVWIIAGAAALLLVIGLTSLCVGKGDGEDASESYADLAGYYELYDVEVFDQFGFPGDYREAGNCVIDEDGNIEFPYYDGEVNGKGSFGMLEGSLKRYEYAAHDYEITIDNDDAPDIRLYDLFLDTEGNRIVIHEDGTRRSGSAVWSRKIDYMFR